MIKEFVMTQEDLDKLLEASKPVPYMIIGGHPVGTPQENANRAWQELASRLGFVWHTVKPGDKGDLKHFYAEPIE